MSDGGDGGVYARLGKTFKHIVNDDRKVVKYALERWDNTFRLQVDRSENKRERIFKAKAELYQLISFYSIFQGVVLTTVAKASNLTCNNSYGSAMVSALVSVAAICGLHDRLLFYYDAKSALISEEAKARVTLRKINYVLSEGPSFKFENMDEQWPPQDVSAEDEFQPVSNLHDGVNQESVLFTRKPKRPAQFNRDPEKHYWLVMTFLIVFSVVVFANCLV